MNKPYLQWLEDDGYYIREDWDHNTQRWKGAGRLVPTIHQKEILGHCLTPDDKGDYPYGIIIYSCIKKSGKTTILGSVGAWAFEEGPPHSEIYSIANDLDQAQARCYTDIRYHLDRREIINRRYRAENPDTKTFIQAIAKEFKGAAGSRPLLSMWDELWGYESERGRLLWAEMTTPTVQNAMRFITTYAGFYGKSELLWELYENNWVNGDPVPGLEHIVNSKGEPCCRHRGRIFVYWDDVPRMPWQTQEYYEEEAQHQRPSDFLRLHRNAWVTGEEEFIDVKYWDKATVLPAPLLHDQTSRYRRAQISVGVDASWKKHETVVVGCYYDPVKGKVGQAFHRIWTPGTTGIDLEETVEAYIMAMTVPFNINAVVYDPRQLHRSMTTLQKRGISTIEMPQTSKNLVSITMNLYDLLKEERFMVYPNDECRERIQFARVDNKGGNLQFIKNPEDKIPNDYCLALAMAAYDAIKRGGVDTTVPVRIESPYGHMTDMQYTQAEIEANAKLPVELRTAGPKKTLPENWNPQLDLGRYRREDD